LNSYLVDRKCGAAARQQPLSLILSDVDQFKASTTCYTATKAGDECLERVRRR